MTGDLRDPLKKVGLNVNNKFVLHQPSSKSFREIES